MHGDTLCTGDHAYLAFRAQVREPRLAGRGPRPADRGARSPSRAACAARAKAPRCGKGEAIMDVAPEAVEAGASSPPGCRLLIHGHTHRPARHEHRGRRARLRALGASGLVRGRRLPRGHPVLDPGRAGRLTQGSSSLSVRHLAEPPAFMNSESGVCTTSKPRRPSASTKAVVARFTTIVRPAATALHAKASASSSPTAMRLRRGHEPLDRGPGGRVEGRAGSRGRGRPRAGRSRCPGGRSAGR